MTFTDKSVTDIAKSVNKLEVSAPEVLMDFILRIENNNYKLGACIKTNFEGALKKASLIERRIMQKKQLPLAGVPFTVTDDFFVKGDKCSCGSELMNGFYPDFTATVIERLEEAGAICIGRISMDEFMLSDICSENAAVSIRNPWDTHKIAGPCGAGSCVAAGFSSFALGTDISGQLRLSSALCGVTTMIPSAGSVSKYGIFTAVPSLACVAPVARSAKDCASILQIISGKDGKDLTCTRNKMMMPMYDITKFKIGVPVEFTKNMDAEMRAKMLSLPDTLKKNGAEAEVFSLPELELAPDVTQIIVDAETAVSLNRFNGALYAISDTSSANIRAERLSYDIKRRIMLGNFVLSGENYEKYYKKALKVKKLISEAVEKALEKYDIIMLPMTVVPTLTAEKLRSLSPEAVSKQMCGCISNLSGLPSMTVPCGFTANGMPVGCQIIGKPNSESSVLSAAATYQVYTQHHLQSAAL